MSKKKKSGCFFMKMWQILPGWNRSFGQTGFQSADGKNPPDLISSICGESGRDWNEKQGTSLNWPGSSFQTQLNHWWVVVPMVTRSGSSGKAGCPVDPDIQPFTLAERIMVVSRNTGGALKLRTRTVRTFERFIHLLGSCSFCSHTGFNSIHSTNIQKNYRNVESHKEKKKLQH